MGLFPLCLLFLGFIQSCRAGCYFSAELQGEFVMQLQFQGTNAGVGHVQYSQVNISAEAIPIWGRCHRRIGNNVILMDSSGGDNCIRCFHLKLVARNVLQVHTEGLNTCYTTEEAAERTCPDEAALLRADKSKEILLYKTKELDGEDVRKEYCPIWGKFTFQYNVNDGLENKMECPSRTSELDNCPAGNALNLRFRQCSFDNHDITFECLGHWSGPDNQRYLALMDTRVGAERRAQYRCALYRENEATGHIDMAFSSDSTCSTDLHSAERGYETLSLTRIPVSNWPPRVTASACSFPAWAQGRWEHVTVQGNLLTYRDHSSLKTYSVRCIGPDQGPNASWQPIYYKTQCGEENYSCIWLKDRGSNVLEFQIGLLKGERFSNSMCAPSNFLEKVWITQARTDRVQKSPCPITGEYTGHIPDATGLCAKLSSDCANPEVMYYTVSDCTAHSEVYEATSKRRYSGRPRRETQSEQTGVQNAASKIYRISSNPRQQASASPSSSSSPDLEHRGLDQQQEASWRSVQWQPQTARSHGPMYPTSYNLHLNSSGSTSSSTAPPSSSIRPGEGSTTLPDEEEYDPWAFPKMHGFQGPSAPARSHASWNRNPTTARPVMYFNSQSGYRDPAQQQPVSPNPFYFYRQDDATSSPSTPVLPSLSREVAIGRPTARSGSLSPAPASTTTVRGVAHGGTYRGRPVEIPPPLPPELQSRAFPGRMRIVPMGVPIALSSRAPTDRGMDFGGRGVETWAFQERSSTARTFRESERRVLQPHDSGWTLEGIALASVAAQSGPRSEARSASPFRTEEREYRCLGQWEEGNLVYTYTQRKDVGTYECFVGSIVSENDIYIKEAGEHCERDVDPLKFGMRLRRKGDCVGSVPSLQPSTPLRTKPTTPWPITRRPVETHTKPWKPITAPPRPRPPVQSSASGLQTSSMWILAFFLTVLIRT